MKVSVEKSNFEGESYAEKRFLSSPESRSLEDIRWLWQEIRQLEFFRELIPNKFNPRQPPQLLKDMSVVLLNSQNSIIYQQGDFDKKFYVILRGEVKLVKKVVYSVPVIQQTTHTVIAPLKTPQQSVNLHYSKKNLQATYSTSSEEDSEEESNQKLKEPPKTSDKPPSEIPSVVLITQMREETIRELKQGQYFGENELVYPMGRQCTAISINSFQTFLGVFQLSTFINTIQEFVASKNPFLVSTQGLMSLIPKEGKIKLSYSYIRREFPLNEIIYKQEQPVGKVYYIESGRVALERKDTKFLDGVPLYLRHREVTTQTLCEINEKQFFGDEDLLNVRGVRKYTAVVISETVSVFEVDMGLVQREIAAFYGIHKTKKMITSYLEQRDSWRRDQLDNCKNVKDIFSNIHLKQKAQESMEILKRLKVPQSRLDISSQRQNPSYSQENKVERQLKACNNEKSQQIRILSTQGNKMLEQRNLDCNKFFGQLERINTHRIDQLKKKPDEKSQKTQLKRYFNTTVTGAGAHENQVLDQSQYVQVNKSQLQVSNLFGSQTVAIGMAGQRCSSIENGGNNVVLFGALGQIYDPFNDCWELKIASTSSNVIGKGIIKARNISWNQFDENTQNNEQKGKKQLDEDNNSYQFGRIGFKSKSTSPNKQKESNPEGKIIREVSAQSNRGQQGGSTRTRDVLDRMKNYRQYTRTLRREDNIDNYEIIKTEEDEIEMRKDINEAKRRQIKSLYLKIGKPATLNCIEISQQSRCPQGSNKYIRALNSLSKQRVEKASEKSVKISTPTCQLSARTMTSIISQQCKSRVLRRAMHDSSGVFIRKQRQILRQNEDVIDDEVNQRKEQIYLSNLLQNCQLQYNLLNE